jgi:gag-polyprotein putative aspartyl protease
MVKEGHCIFREGRVYMADGGEVPKVGPGENLAAVIRSLGNRRRNNTAGAKAAPNRPPQVSYVEAFEPEDSEQENMGSESDAMAANPAMWQHVFVADRTKKPNPRFNPIDREKRVHWKNEQKEARTASSKQIPYVDLPPSGHRSNVQKNFTEIPSIRPPTTEPRKEGPEKAQDNRGRFEILKPTYTGDQKNSQRTKPDHLPVQDDPVVDLKAQPNIRKSDFIMRQDSQPNASPPKILPKSPPKNRFTTTMRQQHTSGDIYHKVLGTGITLPLGELLAVCPEIEKTLSADTRLRTVPVTHAKSGDYDEEMAEAFANVSPHETRFEEIYEEDDCSAYACGNSAQRSPDTSTAKNRNKGHHYKNDVISPTGSFVIKIGNRDVVAMVDSGAEMNMITPGLAEEFRNHFAEDETGKKYKMKNVSGVVSQLNGRFNDIPVGVGGHHLNTTFFVGDPWDSYFEAILGQTFLQSFACDLTWSDTDCNHIHMRIHPTGSRHDDAISVRLVKHGTRDRKARAAHASVAQAYSSDSDDVSGNPDDRNSIPEEPQGGARERSQTIGIPYEEDIEMDSGSETPYSDEPSEPSPDEDSFDDGYASSASEGESENDNRCRPRTAASAEIGVQGIGNPQLEIEFNNAVNDLRRIVRPQSVPIRLADA